MTTSYLFLDFLKYFGNSSTNQLKQRRYETNKKKLDKDAI